MIESIPIIGPWLAENWLLATFGAYLLIDLVKITPWGWDDTVVEMIARAVRRAGIVLPTKRR